MTHSIDEDPRKSFPVLCFKEQDHTSNDPMIAKDSVPVECTICGQKVWKAPSTMLVTVDDQVNEIEEAQRVKNDFKDLKPVCTDCGRDMYMSMTFIVKGIINKKKFNQNED